MYQVVKNHEVLIKKLEKENEEIKLLLAKKEHESSLKVDLLNKSILN
jgi:hypothetical protein